MSLNLFSTTKTTKGTKGTKSWSGGVIDDDHGSGLGSPLTSEALLAAHDGIAGAWAQPHKYPTQFPPEPAGVDDHPTLARWSSDARAQVFLFDLLEPYTFVPDGDKATLKVRQGGQPVPFVTISRPDDKLFHAQVHFLADYADLRPDRISEILAQTTDIASFAGSIGMLHPERTARTLELLSLVGNWASIVVMRFKHALASRRPVEFSAQVQPIIQTPAHSSFPHGHATQAFVQACVMSELVKEREAQVYSKDPKNQRPEERVWWTMLRRQAIRITVNRVVAGVHFPVDGAAGALLGLALGREFVARMEGGPRLAYTFDGKACDASDVQWRKLIDKICADPAAASGEPKYVAVAEMPKPAGEATKPSEAGAAPEPDDQARTLKWLWKKAGAEWADL